MHSIYKFYRLCWLFESGYFYWNKAREERNYFTSYPCVSPVEAAFLTYDDIEAGKLQCNSSDIVIGQNCTKYLYNDDYNQDTRISQMSKNTTTSPDREKTGNNYIRRDTNKLPDGFWILVGMLIMVLPFVVVVILFRKYLAPCFKPLPKLKSKDNTTYHDKLTLRGAIRNTPYDDTGHVDTNKPRFD